MIGKVKHIILYFLTFCFCQAIFAQNIALEKELAKRVFLKQHVSKTVVNVGEPVTITYELYSAIHSQANIIHQPNFTGFTVNEIIKPSNNVVSYRDISGTNYTVFTFKKIIITPIDTGSFIIDSITLDNAVTLKDGNDNIYPWARQTGVNTDDVYHYSMYTAPIELMVLSSTVSNSSTFEGVNGDFKIDIFHGADSVTVGTTSNIIITFTGWGEFDKIKLPNIDFGKNVVIGDTVVQQKADSIFYTDGFLVTGYKQFSLSITFNQSGTFIIPRFNFSFYNPEIKKIITVTTQAQLIHIYNKQQEEIVVDQLNKENLQLSNKVILTGLIILLLLILLVVLFAAKSKRKNTETAIHNPVDAINKQLQIARSEIYGIDEIFYSNLKSAINNVLLQQFGITHIQSKEELNKALIDKNIPEQKAQKLSSLIATIETNLFSPNIQHQYRASLFEQVQQTIQEFLSK